LQSKINSASLLRLAPEPRCHPRGGVTQNSSSAILGAITGAALVLLVDSWLLANM